MRYVWRALVAALVVIITAVAAPAVSFAASPAGRPTQAIDPVQVETCEPINRSRFADCKSRLFSWNLRQTDPTTGPIIGTAMAAVTLSEVTATDSRAWTAHYTVRIFGLEGEARVGTTASIVAECRGACAITGGGSQPAVPVGNNSILSGDIEFVSDGAPLTTSSQIINLYLFNPAAVGSGTTAGSNTSRLGPVRCDDGTLRFGFTGTPGCILESYAPTFVINSPEFPHDPAPLHAAFVARAQLDPKV